MIGKLLLIIIIIDSKQLNQKKSGMNIGAFDKIYNWSNNGLIHKTHRKVELEIYTISRA